MAKTTDDLLTKIQRSRDALDVLWQKTESTKKSTKTKKHRLEILAKMRALDEQKQKVLGAIIRQSGEEYEAVTKALDKASDQMEETIEDLSKLAKTLKTIGAAIDLLMKFKPT